MSASDMAAAISGKTEAGVKTNKRSDKPNATGTVYARVSVTEKLPICHLGETDGWLASIFSSVVWAPAHEITYKKDGEEVTNKFNGRLLFVPLPRYVEITGNDTIPYVQVGDGDNGLYLSGVPTGEKRSNGKAIYDNQRHVWNLGKFYGVSYKSRNATMMRVEAEVSAFAARYLAKYINGFDGDVEEVL